MDGPFGDDTEDYQERAPDGAPFSQGPEDYVRNATLWGGNQRPTALEMATVAPHAAPGSNYTPPPAQQYYENQPGIVDQLRDWRDKSISGAANVSDFLTHTPGTMTAAFGGPKMRGFDPSQLAKAQATDQVLLSKGLGDQLTPHPFLWQETGWTRDHAGNWYNEFDDSGMKLKMPISQAIADAPVYQENKAGTDLVLPRRTKTSPTYADLVDDPETVARYPQIGKARIGYFPGSSAVAFLTNKGNFGIGSGALGKSDEEMLGVLGGHEKDHAISAIEKRIGGFGSSPYSTMQSLYNRDSKTLQHLMEQAIPGWEQKFRSGQYDPKGVGLVVRNYYPNNIGEARANNAWDRLGLSAQDKAKYDPSVTERMSRALQWYVGD
jgi:hypothetical protein